ncbi:sugar porter family MFS transporter [Henriciella sp.]|uniref:sugar porter family MFS transporter n=1 Tax=Henriciella sp. TaxID=1968823 RepID=UPI00263596E6|nr:sugar porter family MFS transporter [Henriciella sp.]
MSDTTAVSGRFEGDFAFVLLISCVATIGGFLFGFDSGVINGTVEGLQVAFDSESAGTGFNVASMLLGCAAGAALAGRLSDLFGRRTMMIVAASCFIVSAWGSGIASNSAEFVFYRILGGLAVGAASVMSPAYISEIAPARFRGRLSSIQQVAIITGLFVAFLSNYMIQQAAGSALNEWMLGYEAWRWMFWVELLPATFFLVALLFIPESPRFLVVQGKQEQAQGVLTRISGERKAEAQVGEIERSLAADHKPRMSDVVAKGTLLRPIVWIGIGLATFQQLVGINVVFYYGAVLWQAVGFSEGDALLINVISGLVSIIAVIVALTLIDRIGRKPLLLVGSIGMAVTLGILVVCFSQAVRVDGSVSLPGAYGLIALLAANGYVMFFNGSWGPVMWVSLGEMFPNQIRGSGLAVSGFFQWISNFLITLTFPLMLASAAIGLTGAYGFYAVFAFISIFFVWKAVRETKGMELEEMTN